MTQVMYHFCTVNSEGTPVLNYGDGREVKVGETLTVDCTPELCVHGLHASPRIIDALPYAPDGRSALQSCALDGDRADDQDKSVARSRTCLAIVDADETEDRLHKFARWCALSVAHLWDMPDVVRRYLESGDEALRPFARDAAQDAAQNAARNAARAAVWAAAQDAAQDAAWDAAQNAARNAARAAVWAAAQNAVQNAAQNAARDAAWDAARAATWAAQENELRRLFPELEAQP